MAGLLVFRTFTEEMLHARAISSVALFEVLTSRQGLRLIASDLYTRILIKRVGSWRVAFAQDGMWIQVSRGRILMNCRQKPGTLPVANVLLTKLLAPRIVAASQGSTEQRVIPLFHPLACALAESTPRFKLAETDILSLSADSCDVARVMSVLFNWPDELRQQALKSIARSVRDGGLMVVGQQTGASPLHLRCSIFRRCGMRMEWVGTLGRAAKEHDAILALEI